MSKDAFNHSGGAGEQDAASALRVYVLMTRLGPPEETVELCPIGDIVITPDMLDDEDTPCVRIINRDRDFHTFDFPPFPVDYPMGYLPPGLWRYDWEQFFPDGPSFDDLAEGDWIKIEFSYDPDPEKKGHFDYEIRSIRHDPAKNFSNVAIFAPRQP